MRLKTSRANDEEIDLKRSGAGKQQRVTLAIWEWTSKLVGNEDDESVAETILVYDEPDTHLDYERQRGFLDLMQLQCAKAGVQVVLATHSLNLLDRVDMANIVSLRTVDNRTTIDAVIDDSHDGLNMFASDLTQSLGLRNSVLLNEKCFLVVEGETERLCFPLLFRLYHGLPLQSVGIALMACGGNEGALKVATFLNEQGRSVF